MFGLLPNFIKLYLFKLYASYSSGGSAADWMLCHAISTDDNAIAKYAVKNGANVNFQPPTREFTMLSYVAAKNSLATLKLFLENGADIDAKDAKGHTALYYAVGYGRLNVVELLLEKGANVNAEENLLLNIYNKKLGTEDKELHFEFIKTFEAIAKLLIEKGINIAPEQKAQLQELGIIPANKVETEFTQEIITPVEDVNAGILVGAQLIPVVEEV